MISHRLIYCVIGLVPFAWPAFCVSRFASFRPLPLRVVLFVLQVRRFIRFAVSFICAFEGECLINCSFYHRLCVFPVAGALRTCSIIGALRMSYHYRRFAYFISFRLPALSFCFVYVHYRRDSISSLAKFSFTAAGFGMVIIKINYLIKQQS